MILLFLTGCHSTPQEDIKDTAAVNQWTCEAIFRNHDEYFFTPKLSPRQQPPEEPAL